MAPGPAWRSYATSAFIVFHLAAIAWWNLGVIPYRPEHLATDGDVWNQIKGGADAVDSQHYVRGTLEGYMRGAALWQQWILFGPDAPHEAGRVELFGIVAFDEHGRPVLDPKPIRTSEDPTIAERTQMIGNPACGWEQGSANPLASFLQGSYARYHARQAQRERGTTYIGVELRCSKRKIHQPGQDPHEHTWVPTLLWAGALQPEPEPEPEPKP